MVLMHYIDIVEWCCLGDSNPRPIDYESIALPSEPKQQRRVFYPNFGAKINYNNSVFYTHANKNAAVFIQPFVLREKIMEEYRPILYVLSLFIAWWAQAMFSSPALPDTLSYLLLCASSLWLISAVFIHFREHRRLSALFILALALCPHMFYGEFLLLSQSPDFRADRVDTIYVIYNVMRYALLLCTFIILVLRLLRKLNAFADETPLRPKP